MSFVGSSSIFSRRARVLRAGLFGGFFVGLVDAVSTLVAGTSGTRSPLFVLLAAAAVGLGGLLLALGFVLLSAAAQRGWPGRGKGEAETMARADATAATLLAAPLVVYDAFALFQGAKAARLPGHQIVSVLIAAAGLFALWRLGTAWGRALRQGQGQGQRDGGGRGRAGFLAAVALGAGVASHWANRTLLPRLYPWFHVTLGLAFLALAVLGTGALLAGHPRLARGLSRRATTALAVALVLAAGILAGPRLVSSQTFRFAAFERTFVAGLLLRAVPLPKPQRIVARAHREAFPDEERTPLPIGPRRPDADVVLVTIDALRADHVGAYGYHRNVTPNLDALAKRSIVFERAYAQAPHTSYSVASMLTGKYYPTIARLAPGDPHDPVTAVLRRYNWKTAAFYPPAVFYRDAQKLKAYEDHHFDFEYVKVEFLDVAKRLGQIQTFFEVERPKKAFLWLHVFEPHETYDVHEGFDLGRTDVDRYDSEIAYSDAALGKILAWIEKERPGAIVIVTADHGEEFDEHKGRYHGSTLYEEQIRVPLIVHVPGVTPHRVSGQVELIDIAPTILGLLDIPIPVRMRGTDLGPWLAYPPAPERRLPPAFAEVADKRMVVWNEEKLICDLNWGYCAYHDLKQDPREQKNAADEHPDRVAVLKGRLDDWLDDHGRFEPQLLRGLANPHGGDVPKAIARGRLGDLGAVKDLAAMLESTEPLPVRREAARLLVTALPPRKETRELVVAALDADDAEVRDWAHVVAVRLGEEVARPQLQKLVLADSTPKELRVHGGLALAQVNDATGVEVLGDALDRCEDIVLCGIIIQKLGSLRDPRAVPALLAHLHEVLNRREMVEALGQIAEPGTVPALVERLESDEYVPVRAEAAKALGEIQGPRAKAALHRALGTEREATVLEAIRAALARWSSPPPSRKATPTGTPGRKPTPGKGRSLRPPRPR